MVDLCLSQVDFIEKTIATEKRLQTITYIAAFAVIALVVFAGATFGLTYVVIDMTKEAQPAVSQCAFIDSHLLSAKPVEVSLLGCLHEPPSGGFHNISAAVHSCIQRLIVCLTARCVGRPQ
jgi:hypothetical protein